MDSLNSSLGLHIQITSYRFLVESTNIAKQKQRFKIMWEFPGGPVVRDFVLLLPQGLLWPWSGS